MCPKTKKLIAAVINDICQQCDSQVRTFNEIAYLTGKNIGKIEKFYLVIDNWFYLMSKPEMKGEVKEKKLETKGKGK